MTRKIRTENKKYKTLVEIFSDGVAQEGLEYEIAIIPAGLWSQINVKSSLGHFAHYKTAIGEHECYIIEKGNVPSDNEYGRKCFEIARKMFLEEQYSGPFYFKVQK